MQAGIAGQQPEHVAAAQAVFGGQRKAAGMEDQGPLLLQEGFVHGEEAFIIGAIGHNQEMQL